MIAPLVPPSAHHLVGRAREQATLRAALDAALAGRGSLVLIGGEAGIGKTTLAEALCAEATGRGATVLLGRCYDLSETPPYGPWAEALAHAPYDSEPPDLTGGMAVASQAAIFAQMRDYLAILAARRPLVLLLDDLHWADPASLDLLRVVGRNLAGLPLLLLATYRDDEPDGGYPLASALPALVREARADRLTLARLSSADVGPLLRARYRLLPADERRLVAHLDAYAEGNPFYAGEVLRSLEEEGLLGPAHGGDGWVLGDLASTHVPPLLRQVIGARVARLGDDARRLLMVAAVIGQVVPLDLWAAVGEADDELLADVVGRAVTARMLAEASDGAGVRFAHALVREALYEAIPLPRRRALHRRVADALLAAPHPDPDAVAGHLVRAGDPRAVEWLIEAGHRAYRAFVRKTAAERYAAALRLVGDNIAESGRRGWILVYLAQARYFEDARGGIALLEEAERLALAANDRALAAYARYHLGTHRSASGDWRRGVAEMVEGAALLDDLSDGRWEEAWGGRWNNSLDQRLAYTGLYDDFYVRLRRYSGRALPHSSEYALAEAEAGLGRADDARQAWVRGREGARRNRDQWSLGLYAAFELHGTLLPYWADDLDMRRRLAREAEEELRVLNALHDFGSVRIGSFPLLVLEGGWAEAREIAAAVLVSNRAYRAIAASLLAAIAHAQGDVALAQSLVQRLLPGGPKEEPGGTWHHDGLRLQRLAATMECNAGNHAAARDWLVAHDRWLAWNGAVRGRAEGQLAWADYYRAMGDLDAACRHAEQALNHASDPRQPLALLAAHRLLGELATAAGRRAEAVTHLDASLALAAACAAPYERALTLLALVALSLAEREWERAGEVLAEANAIVTRLEAHPTLARCAALAAHLDRAPAAPPNTSPPLPPVVPTPCGLTAREVEVLRLIAAGRSNREMAAALSRSERTIERHLENIYRKIDARNRADATAFAFRHALA